MLADYGLMRFVCFDVSHLQGDGKKETTLAIVCQFDGRGQLRESMQNQLYVLKALGPNCLRVVKIDLQHRYDSSGDFSSLGGSVVMKLAADLATAEFPRQEAKCTMSFCDSPEADGLVGSTQSVLANDRS